MSLYELVYSCATIFLQIYAIPVNSLSKTEISCMSRTTSYAGAAICLRKWGVPV